MLNFRKSLLLRKALSRFYRNSLCIQIDAAASSFFLHVLSVVLECFFLVLRKFESGSVVLLLQTFVDVSHVVNKLWWDALVLSAATVHGKHLQLELFGPFVNRILLRKLVEEMSVLLLLQEELSGLAIEESVLFLKWMLGSKIVVSFVPIAMLVLLSPLLLLQVLVVM